MDSGGGGVVAEICRDPFSVGGGGSSSNYSLNCSNRPSIRVFQTCIVFSPNNFDSLPELE